MCASLYRWAEMPKEQVSERFGRKFIAGQNTMVCWLELKPGCVVPEHNHESEQVSYVVEGTLRFRVAGEEFLVEAGSALLIPPHTPHSAEVVGEGTVIDLDIFSPVRRDWLEGRDDYLRGS